MSAPPSTVALPGHVVDLARHALLTADGQRVDLRPQALDLLCLLAARAGETVDKRHLIDVVWPGLVVTDDSLVQAVGDIRRAIGDNQHQVLQTVPRRGYRLIAAAPAPAIEPAPGAPDIPPRPSSPPTPVANGAPTHAPQPPATARAAVRARRARMVAWLVTGLVLAGAVAAWQPWRRATVDLQAVSPDRPPIAVLDFGDPGAPAEDRQMARAYAEELIGELGRNADLAVISAQSSLAAGARSDDVAQIAKRLGVGYLVTGSLRREDERLRLLVQLVDGRDSRVVWTERHDVAAPQVYAVRDALVQRIAATLHTSMRSHLDARAEQRPPASMDLYSKTLRAITLKHRFTPQASAEARALLESVVAEDPQYAPGWLYLGFVNVTDYASAFTVPRRREMLHQAVEQLERAAVLDPRLSQAQAGLALAYLTAGRHDDAVHAGRRCVELAPSDADCLVFLAHALLRSGLAEAALPYMRRVIAVSPLPASYVLLFYADTLWANRLFDEALAQYDACITAFPNFYGCWINRAYARAEVGRIDEARADLAEWQRQIGPAVRPDPTLRGSFGPGAQSQVQRRAAALALMQGGMPSPATGASSAVASRRP